ncbi:hypothetical protein [Mycolicibacterium sarraceniae]|uniref:Uncharacterized protein n=1 Tax=Mycolicibacterium sarraceniae TaxID=1534348 RepID=A0A7I7SJJ0_9MYCO|nr:hypothetical protein [Mycolicibacterium sarraceniae]BBY56933.1 hypothetical protein MSAR_00690 [Mycolicibacterium sarraceniae]
MEIIALGSAAAVAVAVVKLARAIRRENRRIDGLVDNADQIIADTRRRFDEALRYRESRTRLVKMVGTLGARPRPLVSAIPSEDSTVQV